MIIINRYNGKVESANVFDTYKNGNFFDAFIQTPVPKGSIVVAACKDECSTNLSDSAKQWF